jgi:hypothetical protein
MQHFISNHDTYQTERKTVALLEYSQVDGGTISLN